MNKYKKTMFIIGAALTATQAYSMNPLETFLREDVLIPIQQTQNLFNQSNETLFFNLDTASMGIQGYIKDTGNDLNLIKAFKVVDTLRQSLVFLMQNAFQVYFAQPHQLNATEKEGAKKIMEAFQLMANKNIPELLSKLQNMDNTQAKRFLESFGNMIRNLASQANRDLQAKLDNK